jgi:hypothetical protein
MLGQQTHQFRLQRMDLRRDRPDPILQPGHPANTPTPTSRARTLKRARALKRNRALKRKVVEGVGLHCHSTTVSNICSICQAPAAENLWHAAAVPFPRRQVDSALRRVRSAALGLPETSERLSHGAPTFFVRDKTSFVMFHDDHHGDGRLAIWCAAPPGVQEVMVEAEPDRFFRPPYVGHRGWLGVRLDVDPDWDEIAAVVEDAFRAVAPKRLIAQLDGG